MKRDIFADSSDEDSNSASNEASPTSKPSNKKLKFSPYNESLTSLSLKKAPLIVETADGDCDDSEGYYKIRLGELLDNRYCVYAFTGKGVFSNVVKARCLNQSSLKSQDSSKPFVFEKSSIIPKISFKLKDLNDDDDDDDMSHANCVNTDSDKNVAIKIVRNNEAMRKIGLRELKMLRRLNDSDRDDKYHCLKLYDNFTHRNHLCLVLESLCMNLREVLKKSGQRLGSDRIDTTRDYGKQLLLALSLLKRCNILHADIKPDNILVDETYRKLKLCDFGSAVNSNEIEITPYLVSRFYRAPEIILGTEYDYALDLWSVGCTLYEVFTGDILFEGKTNNHMLKLIMDLKGKFPHKMIKRGQLFAKHFDDSLNFIQDKSIENENAEGVIVVKNLLPIRDLKKELIKPFSNISETSYKDINQFKNLLDRITTLDPSKRPSVEQMLIHAFIEPKACATDAGVRT